MRRWISGAVRTLALGLGLWVLGTISPGWAQEGDKAPAAGALWEKLQEPLSPWATAVFVWLVLFVVMAFMVGVAWLTRPRRY